MFLVSLLLLWSTIGSTTGEIVVEPVEQDIPQNISLDFSEPPEVPLDSHPTNFLPSSYYEIITGNNEGPMEDLVVSSMPVLYRRDGQTKTCALDVRGFTNLPPPLQAAPFESELNLHGLPKCDVQTIIKEVIKLKQSEEIEVETITLTNGEEIEFYDLEIGAFGTMGGSTRGGVSIAFGVGAVGCLLGIQETFFSNIVSDDEIGSRKTLGSIGQVILGSGAIAIGKFLGRTGTGAIGYLICSEVVRRTGFTGL